ncbi:MAG: LysR substrate-binding domain-containing protein [Rhodobacteraceae bacterium]|nr:LysR substrate-binding domain-containing protein [Paracoccaceae bacterium]
MHLRNLQLNALRTFEAAARRLSFKEAADELCVSATTVSNQIRRLERDLGCQLFVRKTRAVLLTDAGRSLAKVLTRSLEDIRAEVERHSASRRRRVSLAVGPIFGARWMIPRFDRFRADHPDIELELRHSPRITDASMMQADIAVDWGVGDWSGLEAQPLLRILYSPVVSPALAARLGRPETPRDVARFPIIHQHDRSEWLDWLRHAGCPDLPLRDHATIVDTNVVIQAALDGSGMALGIFPFCQSFVDSGQLLKPFDIDLAPTRSFHLLTRPGARRNREIAEICRWLEREAQPDG